MAVIRGPKPTRAKGYRPWPDATRDILQHLRLKHYYEEAAQVATILADAFPYDVAAQLTAAQLAGETGDGRDRPRLLWRAARGQAAAGDTQAARDNLEQLLALAPDHAQARRLLDSLGAGSQ